MNADAYRAVLGLLRRLECARIYHSLRQSRDDAVMIEVVVPGERWEIELVDYGDQFHWEVERFRSDGAIKDESAIEDLFATFSEPIDESADNPENHAETLRGPSGAG